MPRAQMHQIHLDSPAATDRLARALAPVLGAGDALLLDGPIGAGKTHFARALIKARLAAAGRDEEVPSPTYTLVQTYHDGVLEIWHADLYRLTGPDDLSELGLVEAFATALCLVEWPDRLSPEDRKDALTLSFAHAAGHDGREVTIGGPADRWGRVAAVLDKARGTLDA